MNNNCPIVLLLSGKICSGKTTLAAGLKAKYGDRLEILKSSQLIAAEAELKNPTRSELQNAGNGLDKGNPEWVCDALKKLVSPQPDKIFLVDAIRKKKQLASIKSVQDWDVWSVYLDASPATLEVRFNERPSPYPDDKKDTLESHSTDASETDNEEIRDLSDISIDTERCSEEDAILRVSALIGDRARTKNQYVDVVVGGQYGSEGKGNIAAFLAPEYDLLVRVGGPNAGHSVYAEPSTQKFHHLPSGSSTAPNAGILLGAGSVINPTKLLSEIEENGIDRKRVKIDGQAAIISPNFITEEDQLAPIASTQQGVGIATAKKITDRGNYSSSASAAIKLAKDTPELKAFLCDGFLTLSEHMKAGNKILLEGTQGSSLSLHHGDYPFVTFRDTLASACLSEAGISPRNVNKIIVVFRTYPIRVGGTSGPMNNEICIEEIAKRSGLDLEQIRQTEVTTTTGRERRIAEFDWSQFEKSIIQNGATDIALTFADYLSNENAQAFRIGELSKETLHFIEELEAISGKRVTLVSTCFDFRNVIDRRNW